MGSHYVPIQIIEDPITGKTVVFHHNSAGYQASPEVVECVYRLFGSDCTFINVKGVREQTGGNTCIFESLNAASEGGVISQAIGTYRELRRAGIEISDISKNATATATLPRQNTQTTLTQSTSSLFGKKTPFTSQFASSARYPVSSKPKTPEKATPHLKTTSSAVKPSIKTPLVHMTNPTGQIGPIKAIQIESAGYALADFILDDSLWVDEIEGGNKIKVINSTFENLLLLVGDEAKNQIGKLKTLIAMTNKIATTSYASPESIEISVSGAREVLGSFVQILKRNNFDTEKALKDRELKKMTEETNKLLADVYENINLSRDTVRLSRAEDHFRRIVEDPLGIRI
jgi:hypothetical protein